jgi:hypothetical protein
LPGTPEAFPKTHIGGTRKAAGGGITADDIVKTIVVDDLPPNESTQPTL